MVHGSLLRSTWMLLLLSWLVTPLSMGGNTFTHGSICWILCVEHKSCPFHQHTVQKFFSQLCSLSWNVAWTDVNFTKQNKAGHETQVKWPFTINWKHSFIWPRIQNADPGFWSGGPDLNTQVQIQDSGQGSRPWIQGTGPGDFYSTKQGLNETWVLWPFTTNWKHSFIWPDSKILIVRRVQDHRQDTSLLARHIQCGQDPRCFSFCKAKHVWGFIYKVQVLTHKQTCYVRITKGSSEEHERVSQSRETAWCSNEH